MQTGWADGKETQKVMFLCQYNEKMIQVVVKATEKGYKDVAKYLLFEILRSSFNFIRTIVYQVLVINRFIKELLLIECYYYKCNHEGQCYI